MNFISEAKAEIAGLLDGYRVVTHVPEKYTPPLAIVANDDPYIRPGLAHGDWRMDVELTVVAATGRNREATEAVDEVIADVIERLRGEWTVQTVSTGYVTDNSNQYPAAIFSITTNI